MTNETNRTALWSPSLRPDGTRYEAIVAALEEDVAHGRLHAGDRLPTQRELARTLHLGLGTVTRAYQSAERSGLLHSHVGRGTFVAAAAPGNPLGPPDLDLIELSVDLPLHAEDPDLGAGLAKVARSNDVGALLQYHDHAGRARHRRAGAAWAGRFGVATDADQVVVCHGSQHALCVALMTCAEAGDTVLCDALVYPGLRAVARLLGLRLECVTAADGSWNAEAVTHACRRHRVSAAYVNPSFHNPTTRAMVSDERRVLAHLAVQHDFALLEDDVHRLMSNTPMPSLTTWAPDHTYAIASLSKAVCAGLRVAFLIPPAAAVSRARDAVFASVWMASPVTSELAATWIEDGTADAVVARKRLQAGLRQSDAATCLQGARFEAQAHGYYLWLHLPLAWPAADFVTAARDRGVAVAPATAFALDPAHAPDAVRVCLAAADTRETAADGVRILAEILDERTRA